MMTLRFFFSSRRRHTRLQGDWSSDVCSSDLLAQRRRTQHPSAVAGEHPFDLVGAAALEGHDAEARKRPGAGGRIIHRDRKSTRLNSSHLVISYAVFCLKKKKNQCTADTSFC